MRLTPLARIALCSWVVTSIAPVASQSSSTQSSLRQRIDQSVEMRVLQSPVIVNIDGMPHLVHELHVTNMRREPVTLRQVQVLAPGVSDALADLKGADLAGRVGRPGVPPAPPEPLAIGPGLRAVVYFWTALPGDSRALREVSHRAELTIAAPDGARTIQVNGGTAPVAGAPAIVIDPPVAGGPWLAIYNPALVGGHRTAVYTIDGRARIPGRFAIDWVRVLETRRAGGPAARRTRRPPMVSAPMSWRSPMPVSPARLTTCRTFRQAS